MLRATTNKNRKVGYLRFHFFVSLNSFTCRVFIFFSSKRLCMVVEERVKCLHIVELIHSSFSVSSNSIHFLFFFTGFATSLVETVTSNLLQIMSECCPFSSWYIFHHMEFVCFTFESHHYRAYKNVQLVIIFVWLVIICLIL